MLIGSAGPRSASLLFRLDGISFIGGGVFPPAPWCGNPIGQTLNGWALMSVRGFSSWDEGERGCDVSDAGREA